MAPAAKRPYFEDSHPKPAAENTPVRVQDVMSRDDPITAVFANPSQLCSRDIFRLLSRVWPFIRPYRRDLATLFVVVLPGAATGLFGLLLIRIFFDVVGNGQPPGGADTGLPGRRRGRANRSCPLPLHPRLRGPDTAEDQQP